MPWCIGANGPAGSCSLCAVCRSFSQVRSYFVFAGFSGSALDDPVSGRSGFAGVGKVLIPNPVFSLFNGILGLALQRPGEIEFGRVTIDKKDGRNELLAVAGEFVLGNGCFATVK